MYRPPFHFCHCMNIFPGTALEDKIAAFTHSLPKIRALIPGAEEKPFAAGLWLGADAVSRLIRTGREKDFADFARALGFYAFTANAFPYGKFHGTKVKTSVYSPDWSDGARLEYTLAVARVLAHFLPDESVEGSVSTLPGAYKTFPREKLPLLADNILKAAEALKKLRRESGRTIRLAFEMEPDCLWESPQEFAFFYDRFLRGSDAAEFIGVCYDTCHQELLGGTPGAGLDFLSTNGIPVPKIQISAALRSTDESGRKSLGTHFQDPVYLHQTRIVDSGGILRKWDDLPDALDSDSLHDPWTVHFHIPVFLEELPGGLRSANAELLAVIEHLRHTPSLCGALEIETYSYNVLPEFARSRSVEDSMAREMRWLLEKLEHGTTSERENML